MSYIAESYETESAPVSALSVCQSGWQRSGSGHSFGPTTRDHYVLHYVVKGRGIYRVRGREYEVSEKEGFLILPGDSTYYRADREDPWEYYWTGFSGSEVPRLLALAGLGENRLVFRYDKDDLLKDQLERMYYSSGEYASRELAMTGYLYLCFSCLAGRAPGLRHPADAYLEQAKRYIADSYAYPITVQELADQIGIERSYLYRVFMERLGISVSHYIMRCKMEKARELLQNSRLSVTEISNSLGFGNIAHFSNAFKKNYGLSPAAYRKQSDPEGSCNLSK